MWRPKLCRAKESTFDEKEKTRIENNIEIVYGEKESSVVAVAVATHICTIQMFVHMCPLSVVHPVLFRCLRIFSLSLPSVPFHSTPICGILIFITVVAFCVIQLHKIYSLHSIQLVLHALMHVASLHVHCSSPQTHTPYTYTRSTPKNWFYHFRQWSEESRFDFMLCVKLLIARMANVTASVSA